VPSGLLTRGDAPGVLHRWERCAHTGSYLAVVSFRLCYASGPNPGLELRFVAVPAHLVRPRHGQGHPDGRPSPRGDDPHPGGPYD